MGRSGPGKRPWPTGRAAPGFDPVCRRLQEEKRETYGLPPRRNADRRAELGLGVGYHRPIGDPA